MPIGTVNTDPVRYELKSLEGAWIDLKPMSHGMTLARREISTKQAMRNIGGKQDDAEMAIELAQRAATQYEYRNCIVDHNIEEEIKGKAGEDSVIKKLDFKKPETLDKLDPRVGDEIDQLIEDLNKFEVGEADGSGN